MTERLLELLKESYPLSEMDPGDMGTLKANGMRFIVRAYRAEGLGHVSVMRAKGFFGLMRMDTLIVNPLEIDLPLYSYDRIYAMGNDTLIVELYDTLLGKFSESALRAVNARYASLPERDPGVHWYDSIRLRSSISKKGKKAETERFDRLAEEHWKAYLASPAEKVSDREEKRKKAAFYVNGLLEKGGPSTDVFKKALGEEKTAGLFRGVLFGIEK